MEGVFLSAQIHALRKLILHQKCIGVGTPVRNGMGLVFRSGMLVICARPDSPSLWFADETAASEPVSPVWSQHLRGARVDQLVQQGSDRVMEVHFKSELLYGSSNTRLILEATGRNANIILAREDDGRILACERKITSKESRFRVIAPGQVYKPPPLSGFSPGQWKDNPELERALKVSPSPRTLYTLLEGVGPVTAASILQEACERNEPVMKVVEELERVLIKEEFEPWKGTLGCLPMKLGPGEPMADPLKACSGEKGESIRNHRLETLQGTLRRRISQLRDRVERVESAMAELVTPEEYRTWGNLLLAREDGGRKGFDSLRLRDWEGVWHLIPLKRARSLRSNAQRFFRKAGNSERERSNLKRRLQNTLSRLTELEEILDRSGDMDLEELNSILKEFDGVSGEKRHDGRSVPFRTLGEGWRCFRGRNARENDFLTFKIGRRGDIWFHARGVPGAHVLLKMDGRGQNPPASVMREAAAEAARGSGVPSGVVPVDYTEVQYVSRVRNGKPGQVVYKREKTIFVDLDS